MNNTIDLSKLPISPNEDIKNVVAINDNGDIIVAENDLSSYVTAEEINAELENYPTFTELEDELQTYVEFPDLQDYVKSDEISEFISEQDLEVILSTYATEQDLNNVELKIPKIVKVTQAEYDSMVKDSDTLYIIIKKNINI